MIAELQAVIKRTEGGWLLSLGEFPILTTRSRQAAEAVAILIETSQRDLSTASPVELVMLAGYMPAQCLDPLKGKALSITWGRELTERYLRLAGMETTYEYGGSALALKWLLSGTTTNLPIGP